MKVFISTTTFAVHSEEPLSLLKKRGIDYVLNPHNRKLTEGEIGDILRSESYVGLVAGTEPVTVDVLENARCLKVISRVGVGLGNVNLDVAKRLDIKVYNTPDILVDSVAELTLGLILSCLRRLPSMDRNMRGNVWKKEMGLLFKDKTLGVIGFGKIGKRVADLGAAFGAKIIYYDVRAVESDTFKQTSLEELLERSDIISVHASTKDRLISSGEISKMKEGVILINTARGPVVDEDSLYDALSASKIGCAALDVYNEEPYSGKLLMLDNVVLTPHAGSYAKEARIGMEMEAVENMIKGLGV